MENKTKERVYSFIIKYMKKYSYAPTVREICKGVGLKSTSSVHNQLIKLEQDGKIKMRGNSPRAIKLTGYGYTKLDE